MSSSALHVLLLLGEDAQEELAIDARLVGARHDHVDARLELVASGHLSQVDVPAARHSTSSIGRKVERERERHSLAETYSVLATERCVSK